MALPTDISRPELPYIPQQVLANNDRYQIVTLEKNSPPYQYLDQEMNCVFDWFNTLSNAINDTAAGIIPGADDPANINKIPTPTELGNISWQLIQNNNMDINCVDTDNILSRAITTEKIELNAITADLLAPRSVTGGKIDAGNATANQVLLATGNNGVAQFGTFIAGPSNYGNRTITETKIDAGNATANQVLLATGNNGVAQFGNFIAGTSNYGDGTITTAKIANQSVTAAKIDAGGVPINQVLLSKGNNEGARFGNLPFIGIKQIQSTVVRQQPSIYTTGSFLPFNVPLEVSITPQYNNSIVVIFLSAIVGASIAGGAYPLILSSAIYKNDQIWQEATGVPQNPQVAGLQTGCIQNIYDVANFNTVFIDTENIIGGTKVYSFRSFINGHNGTIILNSNAERSGTASISYMHAMEIVL